MTPEHTEIINEMHAIELRIVERITRVEVKVDGYRETYDDLKSDVSDLETRYNRLLMAVITLLGAGVLNLITQLAQN